MAKNIFFREDFYILQQRVEEDEIVSLLSKDADLNSLVASSANEIKNCIYQRLSGTANNVLPTSVNEDQINRSLQSLLANTRFFDRVDVAASSTLFSFAFTIWCERISSKRHGHDSKFIVQTHVFYWLDYQVVKAIVADDRFSSVDLLLSLVQQQYISHQFYRYLVKCIPQNWLEKAESEWTKADDKLDDIVEGLRTFDREHLETYKSIEAASISSWKYIDQSSRYADYVMLNEKYSFKCAVLLEHDISLWLKLWDNFSNPIMQDAALSYPGFDANDFMAIANQLVDQKPPSTPLQYLILLLAKNLLETSLRITQRVSFYTNEQQSTQIIQTNSKAAGIIAEGREAQKQWLNVRKGLYQNFFKTLKPIVDRKIFDEFIFSQKHRSQPHNTYTDVYNEEIDMLNDAYRSVFVSGSEFDLSDMQAHFNLEKFNFYLSSLQEIETVDDETINALLGQLLLFSSSEEYFWDRSFNPPFWNVMKGISYLLSKSSAPIVSAHKLVDEVKVTQEGWLIAKSPFKLQVRESFFYCGLALLTEYDGAFKNNEGRQNYYKEVVQLIISQVRFSVYDHDDYYLQPLMVCYLAACQFFQEMKSYFEREVVTMVDNLYTVLAVLSATEVKIEKETKGLLEQRVKKELPFEIRKLKGKNLRDKVTFFESAVQKLDLIN